MPGDLTRKSIRQPLTPGACLWHLVTKNMPAVITSSCLWQTFSPGIDVGPPYSILWECVQQSRVKSLFAIRFLGQLHSRGSRTHSHLLNCGRNIIWQCTFSCFSLGSLETSPFKRFLLHAWIFSRVCRKICISWMWFHFLDLMEPC